jgi:hypothetical protein
LWQGEALNEDARSGIVSEAGRSQETNQFFTRNNSLPEQHALSRDNNGASSGEQMAYVVLLLYDSYIEMGSRFADVALFNARWH